MDAKMLKKLMGEKAEAGGDDMSDKLKAQKEAVGGLKDMARKLLKDKLGDMPKGGKMSATMVVAKGKAPLAPNAVMDGMNAQNEIAEAKEDSRETSAEEMVEDKIDSDAHGVDEESDLDACSDEELEEMMNKIHEIKAKRHQD